MHVSLEVHDIGRDPSSNMPIVLLKERHGDRFLPIWVGPGEAAAIAVRLKNVTLARPLTHDLLYHMMRALGGELSTVTITLPGKNMYFADLRIGQRGEDISLDARPSDAIALALSASAEIRADEALLRVDPPVMAEFDLDSMMKPPEPPEPEE